MNLDHLLPLIQCPISKNSFQVNGSTIISSNKICRYPIINGVPIFIDNPFEVKIHPQSHISNALSPKAKEIIDSTQGLVLNLSAGGSDTKASNVIELEYSIFRNTDVVGDAHSLPFRDNVFSACVCMNAFEHYRCPQLVMSEIHRILKPGGCLFLHTSGLQPLHEAPFHFYNVTRYGLQEWLKGYEIQHLGVSPNFNPLYSLSWIASEIEKGVATHQPAELEAFHNITLRELIKFWRSPNARQNSTYETFYRLDSPTQESCAAGWEAIAYKK